MSAQERLAAFYLLCLFLPKDEHSKQSATLRLLQEKELLLKKISVCAYFCHLYTASTYENP